jgi:hypothetical protein
MIKVKDDVCNTRCQQFQKESIKKEETLKSAWFVKNRQRLYDNLEQEKFSNKTVNLLSKRNIDKKTTTQDEETSTKVV